MNLWPYRIFPRYGELCPACARHRMQDDDGALFCYNAMCKAFNPHLNAKFLRSADEPI